MKRLILICAMMCPAAALAQQTVITQPQAVTTGNVSTTITSGGTYQSVWAADTTTRGRAACTIINYGAHTMYVYAGPIAGATHGKSVQLATSQAFYCSTSAGGVLKDQISVDGTTGDGFYAAIQ